MLVEICLASADDAAIATSGGADRIELNAALELGGLTPTLGLVAEVQAVCPLPLIAMLRPRAGGFCCTEREFAVMRRDADGLLAANVAGIACGILDAAGTLDRPRCRALIRAANGREVVLHRAFDLAADPMETLETAIDLGFCRILTSGQRATALAGADLIQRLIERAAGRIEILPAAGIRPDNVRELVQRTGCNQVHASLRQRGCIPPSAAERGRADDDRCGVPFASDSVGKLDADALAQLRAQLG